MLINDAALEAAFKGFKTVFNNSFEAVKSHKDTVAMTVNSTTTEENYGWFGQFPSMRKWVGDRIIKQLQSHGFKIRNELFESTIHVKRADMEDDRVGIYKPLFAEMGRTAKQHPDTLIFELLQSGFDTACYDGQNFFDTDHPIMGPDGVTEVSVSNMQAGAGLPWFLIDASRQIRPVVWQERIGYEFQTVNESNSTHVFMRDEYLYGIRARVNCGFGLWQLAFGSKEALNAENYAAARKAMMDFKGDQDQKLGITPTHLVVPSGLEQQARALILGDVDAGTSNIWKGTAELIIAPYLG